MANKSLSEKEINNIISNKLKQRYFILQEIRIPPAELDIVMLDNYSLCLTNIEIKKGNWKKLFFQTLRGKMYCHYSIAVLPIHLQKSVKFNLFEEEGLGLFFYEEKNGEITLLEAIVPRYSDKTNRLYKRILYQEFSSQYGNMIYD